MERYSAPVIDMKESENLAEKIVKAMEEWGCFRLVNHGVAIELMTQMKAVTLSLMEVKQKNSHPEPGKGYTPPHSASPFFEGLSLYDMASRGAINLFCSQIHFSPHSYFHSISCIILRRAIYYTNFICTCFF